MCSVAGLHYFRALTATRAAPMTLITLIDIVLFFSLEKAKPLLAKLLFQLIWTSSHFFIFWNNVTIVVNAASWYAMRVCTLCDKRPFFSLTGAGKSTPCTTRVTPLNLPLKCMPALSFLLSTRLTQSWDYMNLLNCPYYHKLLKDRAFFSQDLSIYFYFEQAKRLL